MRYASRIGASWCLTDTLFSTFRNIRDSSYPLLPQVLAQFDKRFQAGLALMQSHFEHELAEAHAKSRAKGEVEELPDSPACVLDMVIESEFKDSSEPLSEVDVRGGVIRAYL
jgi:hypothetical protein